MLSSPRTVSYAASMPDNDRLERFADLVVRVGANVQPGSGVLVTADTAHLEIARAVVERAYAAGGLDKDDDERYEMGLNRSAVHTDVVIGGEGMTVTGTGPAGTVEIIRDDEWVLEV